MKTGFTRFNLSYFASDEEVDYILNAIEFIPNDGWIFLLLVGKTFCFYTKKYTKAFVLSIHTISILLFGVLIFSQQRMILPIIIIVYTWLDMVMVPWNKINRKKKFL